MDRSNHYESAFEGWLQSERLCYVAVDETRRALLGDVPVKSLDFMVFGRDGARLVVDVKGRRFPGGKPKKPRRVRRRPSGPVYSWAWAQIAGSRSRTSTP